MKPGETGSSPRKNETPLRGAQSISRAIGLLRDVARLNGQGARLSELSKAAGLNISTAHRLLSVLAAEGLVTHDPESKRYHLGIELYHLGSTAYQYAIRERFRGALERIEGETGDAVFLLIRSGNDALCIDRVEGSYPIKTILVDIGSRRPLGIGAGSLSLIAFLPEDESEEIISSNASRYGHYRKLNASDIRSLAKEARQRGYTISRGLFHEGVISLGFPVINSSGDVLAGITVSAITRRMDSRRREAIYNLVRRILKEDGLTSVTFKR
jgi:DNA-binding IclR family transcriptional regulator